MLSTSGGCGDNTPAPTPTPTPTPTPQLFVGPASATVALNGTQAFTVAVTGGGAPPAVTWTINGVSGGNSTSGTIDANGNYTGPSNFPSPNTFTVTATAASISQSANSTLTVVYPNNNHLAQTIPVKLGTSGGNATDLVTSAGHTTCCSGTLGSLVTRGGNFYILSNNHVLAKSDQGTVGQNISQPGLVDSNCSPALTVATLSQFAPVKPVSGTIGPAPNNVDAAIAAIVPGAVDTSGSILDLGAASPTSIAAAPPSSTVAVPSFVLSTNEGVAKSGRTTGLTCSTVQAINGSVQIAYGSTCGGGTAFTSTYSNQIVINGGTFSGAGDSGSLIVTSDTARPLGLLYGGSNNNTVANPITDVLSALQDPITHVQPSMVGGPDHITPVSCEPTAQAQSATHTQSAIALSSAELQRVTAIKEKYSAQLMRDPSVTGVEIGMSKDHPTEGAIVVHANPGLQPVPVQLEGVRTQVTYSGQHRFTLSAEQITSTTAIKEAHVADIMAQPGVFGFGVGRSADNPAETALVIYVENGKASSLPLEIDGIRTQIVEGERFSAFHWGKEPQLQTGCPARSATGVKPMSRM